MAIRFDFATAGCIRFGPGVLGESTEEIAALGRRILLVTGRAPERSLMLEESLKKAGCTVFRHNVAGEPTVELVRQASSRARQAACDAVVAMGGGSAIDTGKAVAVLLANLGDPLDFLEVVGQGRPLRHPSVTFVAIPTTAGTGSEVTRNAVLHSEAHGVKASLRSTGMLPRLALIDPELTLSLPPQITAATGLDALTQLIEPFVSCRANDMVDLFCLDGMKHSARSLVRAYENGSDLEARTDLCLASLYGGLALANAGLGAVHGFAAAIGGMFPAPHGAVCAALLPHVMRANIRALRKRQPDSEALRRYEVAAQTLTDRLAAKPEDGADWVAETCRRLRIPTLKEYGIQPEHAAVVAEKAARASSMKANPLSLTQQELAETLLAAL